MRKLILMAILIACAAPMTFAQTTSDYPSVEFFAGYSNARVDNTGDDEDIDFGVPGTVTSNSDFFNNERVGFHGFQASLIGNVHRNVGIKGDVSGHFKSEDASVTFTPTGGASVTQNFQTKARLYNVLGGPEFKARNTSAVTPWVHALFGVAHANVEFSATTGPFAGISESDSDTGFAMAFGGGLDFRASNRVSVRASADYNPTFLGNNDTTTLNRSDRQDNLRFSIGLLFH